MLAGQFGDIGITPYTYFPFKQNVGSENWNWFAFALEESVHSLYDKVIQVLLKVNEVEMLFCKGFRRKEGNKNQRFHSLFTIFLEHLPFSQFLKLKKKVSFQNIFMGPGARQFHIWMSQEHPLQRKQQQEAGKSFQTSLGFTVWLNRETPPTHLIGSEPQPEAMWHTDSWSFHHSKDVHC